MYRAPKFHGALHRVSAAPPVPLPAATQPLPYVPVPPPHLEYDTPKRRPLAWRAVRWALMLGIWGAVAGLVLLLWFARDLPRPESALDAVRRPSLALEDRAGRVIATYGDVVGQPVHLNELPSYLPAAVIAVEDRRFWTHGAIDPWGMARALAVNLRAGHVVQGGSTLAQQVAKNLFLSNARTFRRKVQELLLTLWLGQHFSKQQVLEIWLNRVYLGSGAWGMDAAARLYFGVPARRVTLWQAAVLAGLPRAPSRFNPRADPDAARARARQVLVAMVETGAITAAQCAAAERQLEAPNAVPQPPAGAGWFADWVASASVDLIPEGADAIVRTTLDSRLQALAETQLAALLEGPGVAARAGQGAVVVLDADSGAVRAMIGGRGGTDGYNRAVLARRQPGSAFKPFVWLAALEHGLRPDDTVEDAPLDLGGWSPHNDDGRYRGPVTLEEGLAESLNTVAVRLAQRAGGPGAVAAVARRLGVTGPLPDNLTIALGTASVGVLQLSSAYAPFCNGGFRVAPHGLDAVRTSGHDIAPEVAAPTRVIDPDLAGEMHTMLAAVVAHGTGRAAAVPGRTVVGKTGTTQDSRDAWFVGCVAGDVMGVWLGNDDNTPMSGVLGGGLPARLFHEIAMGIR